MKYRLSISDRHLFYKYDLFITVLGFSLLLMWKPTHNNSRYVERYCSIMGYSPTKRLFKFRFGKVPNPKHSQVWN
jgi:hypothetical protein